MGFGTLFLGYLISLNTLAYAGFTKIFAYLVMLLALSKLAVYNRPFKRAYYSLFPLLLIGLCFLGLEVAGMFSLLMEQELSLFRQLCSMAYNLFEMVFSWFLLRGIQDIAHETNVYVLEVRAFRNRLFTTLYYLLFLVGQLAWQSVTFAAAFNLVLLVLFVVIAILNAKLIYNTYMWICLEGDEDMPRRDSGIKFIDKLYRKLDEKEEAMLRQKKLEAEELQKRREARRRKRGKK